MGATSLKSRLRKSERPIEQAAVLRNQLDFDRWWNELVELATQHRLVWLLGDRESHRDSWIDCLSPREELIAQLDAAWADEENLENQNENTV